MFLKTNMVNLSILLILYLSVSFCHADTFYLKDGSIIKGTISEETDRLYKITNGSMTKNGITINFVTDFLHRDMIEKHERHAFAGIQIGNIPFIFILITLINIVIGMLFLKTLYDGYVKPEEIGKKLVLG